jgi:hypothetical protein
VKYKPSVIQYEYAARVMFIIIISTSFQSLVLDVFMTNTIPNIVNKRVRERSML